MKKFLPFTTDESRSYGKRPLQLLDPNSVEIKGPSVTSINPALVPGGVLAGWDADAARAFLTAPPPPERWDSSWKDEDKKFIENISNLSNDELEDNIPTKWLSYKVLPTCDESLARVCKMCTALVDKFLTLSHDNEYDTSTRKWRLYQSMAIKLRLIMEVLESSIGEAIPVLALKNEGFIKKCWTRLGDDDKQDLLSAFIEE